MTNDEAIKMIADDMRLHHDYLSGNYRKALNMAIEALRNSPSQMPGASDLISRQDAIDIINVYAERFNGYIGTPNDSEVYAYARGLLLSVERNIRALPPAQPEIIHCRDCIHYNAGFECLIEGYGVERDGSYFCGDAVRRKDE